MKTKRVRRLSILLLMFLLLSASGCAGDPAADGSDVNTIHISLSILYPQTPEQESVQDYTMQVEEKATVMQVLESYSSQEGVPIQVRDASSPEVIAIGDVAAEEGTQWRCTVNNEDVTDKASEQALEDGDEVVWSFVEI